MRLIFFGSGAFGLPSLERLVAAHDVAAVVTQPDRRAGRGRAVQPTPIAACADAAGIEVIRTAAVNDAELIDRVAAADPDALVVIAFGQKIGPRLLDGRFAINLHASLLPKYRGAAPINWAMINGETETGVSVITLADRMDAGDVLVRASTAIDPSETAGELHDRLSLLGAPLILGVLEAHRDGRLEPAPQDERLATAAPKLAKSDGTVHFHQPADAVRARIHGLTPWPGCAVRVAGERLGLLRVATTDAAAGAPGSVDEHGVVACNPGGVRLLEVQPPSGRVMDFMAYSRGHPLTPDTRVEPL